MTSKSSGGTRNSSVMQTLNRVVGKLPGGWLAVVGAIAFVSVVVGAFTGMLNFADLKWHDVLKMALFGSAVACFLFPAHVAPALRKVVTPIIPKARGKDQPERHFLWSLALATVRFVVSTLAWFIWALSAAFLMYAVWKFDFALWALCLAVVGSGAVAIYSWRKKWFGLTQIILLKVLPAFLGLVLIPNLALLRIVENVNVQIEAESTTIYSDYGAKTEDSYGESYENHDEPLFFKFRSSDMNGVLSRFDKDEKPLNMLVTEIRWPARSMYRNIITVWEPGKPARIPMMVYVCGVVSLYPAVMGLYWFSRGLRFSLDRTRGKKLSAKNSTSLETATATTTERTG